MHVGFFVETYSRKAFAAFGIMHRSCRITLALGDRRYRAAVCISRFALRPG